MGLRNLTFPTVAVQTSGGPLPVRGLSLDHILGLFYRHRDDVTAFYQSVIDKRGTELTANNVTGVALKMIDAAPTMVAEAIAIASGSNPLDPEFTGDVGIARALSLAEQLDALEKIASQTFTSDMPPGKVFALVLQAMQAGTSALQPGLPNGQA